MIDFEHDTALLERDSWSKSEETFILKGRHLEGPSQFSEFKIHQTVFPIERGRYLYLSKNLRLKPDYLEGTFKVVDWPIEIKHDEWADRLASEVVRTYMSYLAKVECDELTESEKEIWIQISSYVNYRNFCQDQDPPRYLEGTVDRNLEDKIVVVWHDGSKSVVRKNSGISDFFWLKAGDRFSAWVKFDLNDIVEKFERVNLIPAEIDSGVDDFDTWINS